MQQQIKRVGFNMSDPLERELLYFAEEKTTNFSGLVKHLLFTWREGKVEMNGAREDTASVTFEEDPSEDIRKSGLPFA
ncbi:hypothetical protein [Mechercharimyces sp. CAU 1602]|uniref:hypothetical protein n=1 Tax=Mechercharimyces sp. CAU 1602 TaxID=2973933 RepID=UPI0021633059|nr:hypothetical protein [Mechercharimyces sp. CAU 1602]MCS1350523.1 hypothetical protein [Mechercharimyces sp. CAU 1602]